MNRRDFISLLSGAAASSVSWSFAARAQQSEVPTIGFLNSASATPYADRVRAFNQGLGELGYVEGRNVAIEYRWANDKNERLGELAADLVRRRVSAIAAGGTRSTLSARNSTAAIPIIFHTITDPVELGLVASLNRPGGNLTGVTSLGVEIGPKRLEVLHLLFPATSAVGLLVNPTFPNAAAQISELQAAARSLGAQLEILPVRNEQEIDAAFTLLTNARAKALIISTDPLFTGRNRLIAALCLRHGIAAISQYREFADVGGLMSYGGSFTDPYRLMGVYSARILRGEKPADLPVQQSTKVELVINLKTAKALGIEVPLSLLGRADEVIE